MRVLDVGSGGGDVSFLAADLVGSNQYVLREIGHQPQWKEPEAELIDAIFPTSHFNLAILLAMHFDGLFDAIIGRSFSCIRSIPATSLEKMMRHLGQGGLVVFQEADCTACRSWPAVPVFDEAAEWLAEGLRSSGARPELGLEMHSLYIECGCKAPRMRMDALISGEGDSPGVQTPGRSRS